MAAQLRQGLIRLADDPRLRPAQARLRALAGGGSNRTASLQRIGSSTLFAPVPLMALERQMVRNGRCW